MKHIKLPDHMRQPTVQDLKEGEQAFIRPADMWVDLDAYLWINPRALCERKEDRYFSSRCEMKIARVKAGFIVWPVPDYLYIPQPGSTDGCIPVLGLKEVPDER